MFVRWLLGAALVLVTGCGVDEAHVELSREAAASDEAALCAYPDSSYVFTVTAKSFIKNIGKNAGTPPTPYDNFYFQGLADATYLSFDEDPLQWGGCGSQPQSMADRKSCRIGLRAHFFVTCNGDTLKAFDYARGYVEGFAGFEGPLQGYIAPPRAKAEPSGEFATLVYGHPNDLVEPGFERVRPRPNKDIWNHVKGKVSCSMGNVKVTFDVHGSKFPSHRAWVTLGTKGKTTAPSEKLQGLFADLWSLENVPSL